MHAAHGDLPAAIHVITQLERGGAQHNTLHTVTTLDRARFIPGLICGPGGDLDDLARASGAMVMFCPDLQRAVHPLHDARALRQIIDALRTQRKATRGPLVVHTHSSKAGILGRVAALRARASVVVHTVHGFGFHDGQPAPVRAAYIAAEREVSPSTHALVFVSRRDMATALDLGIARPGQCHLIRSGIDLSAFGRNADARARIRAEFHVPADAPLVLTVGNFKAQKNPLGALEAFARVAHARPEAHWLTTGDGPLKPRFDARVAELGLQDRVHAPGWRTDIPALQAAADVFMLASDHEGLPRAVLEALTSGVPVAACDAGGTHEVVVPGTGEIVNVGDMEGLAAAVMRLLRHPPADVAGCARDVLAEFDINAMVRKQEALYTELLSRSPTVG